MIERWILDKIEPHKRAPLIILRDPQRVIRRGAHVVDGWAEENGFSVLFCAVNLALREMYEAVRATTLRPGCWSWTAAVRTPGSHSSILTWPPRRPPSAT